MSDGFELPESFDKWPEEDRKEYLEHTKSKRELVDSTFHAAGLDKTADGKSNSSMSKRDWVELYLQIYGLAGVNND